MDEKQNKDGWKPCVHLADRMDTARRARKTDLTEISGKSFTKMKDLGLDVTNRKKNNNGQKVDRLKIHWMRFRKEKFLLTKMRCKYNSGWFMVVNFGKKGREVDLSSLETYSVCIQQSR